MITRIRISGFKSLRDVDLKLGSMNLFVGTNASGKSNFFDALRVLQGIGNGFSIEEILNGKPKSDTTEVWEGIRGGSSRAVFLGATSDAGDSTTVSEWDLISRQASEPTFSIEVHVKLANGNGTSDAIYGIRVAPTRASVVDESFSWKGTPVFSSLDLANDPQDPSLKVKYWSGGPGQPRQFPFEKSRPVLGQLGRHAQIKKEHKDAAEACLRVLRNAQRIDPSPIELRKYSSAHAARRMGDRGENFAALIHSISTDAGAVDAYVSWLRQLNPAEVESVEILEGALGEPLFALVERGKSYPAPILSDGTLRFAAITAAFFQPDMPEILTIEEIENGIHPSRLRLLVELLRSRTKKGGPQVMATTHSPIVLAWLNEKEYETTFFCKRDAETGASTIRPLTEVPDFARIVEKQPIGDLFAENWLEGAL